MYRLCQSILNVILIFIAFGIHRILLVICMIFLERNTLNIYKFTFIFLCVHICYSKRIPIQICISFDKHFVQFNQIYFFLFIHSPESCEMHLSINVICLFSKALILNPLAWIYIYLRNLTAMYICRLYICRRKISFYYRICFSKYATTDANNYNP